MNRSNKSLVASIRFSFVVTALIAILGILLAYSNKNIMSDYINIPSGNQSSVSSSDITTADDTSAATTTTTTAATTTTTTTTVPTTTTTTKDPNASEGTMTVTSEFLNVRTAPGTDSELITKIYTNDKYEVYEQKLVGNVAWLKIRIDGREGWVCSKYVSFTGILAGPKAYLTFDDGPSDNTIPILNILDKYNVKATFFVIYHPNCESLYKEIINRGHTLALHSYTHDYKTIYSSESAFFDDLDKLANYLEQVTGTRPNISRFPGGSSNTVSKQYNSGIMTRLTSQMAGHGYTYYDWNVDSTDASGNGIAKDKLVNSVKNSLGNQMNAVVLMHDTNAKGTTVQALPEIIQFFQNRGYQLLPITSSTPEVHHTVNN